jgi:hypothetical protein
MSLTLLFTDLVIREERLVNPWSGLTPQKGKKVPVFPC